MQPVIEQLQKFGETRRGWLGVRIQNVDDSVADSLELGPVRGALVAGTDAKGPATAGGVEVGDVIVKFDGKDIKESRDLPKIVAQAPVGKDVDVVVMRKGKTLIKTVKLGRLEDGESHAALEPKVSQPPKAPSEPVAQTALGMTFMGLTSASRQKYTIAESVASGVVISGVDPASPAADKRLQPGEVLVGDQPGAGQAAGRCLAEDRGVAQRRQEIRPASRGQQPGRSAVRGAADQIGRARRCAASRRHVKRRVDVSPRSSTDRPPAGCSTDGP